MKRLISVGLGALFVAVSTHGSLFAQSSYGSNGGGGGGGFGSSGGAFSAAGSMFSNSGSAFTSSGSGFGNTGSMSGLGGSTFGGTATGNAQGLVGMSGGAMYGGTGYGANRTGGSSSSSSQYGSQSRGGSQYGQSLGQGRGTSGGSRRGGTGAGGSQGGGGFGPGGGQGAGTTPQIWYEPRITIGFPVAAPQPTIMQTDIAKPMQLPAMKARFGTVNVSVQGDTVVLRGSVASEDDRLLAAQMAMLEPRVFAVKNELVVATPAAAPAPATTMPAR